MPRSRGFLSGKASRAGQARSKERRAAAIDEGTADDEDACIDDGEPPLARPARKKARAEPSRASARDMPQKAVPPRRGPPAAKPKRKPMAEETPEVQEQRRKKQRQYDKDSYARHKEQAADDEAPLQPDA